MQLWESPAERQWGLYPEASHPSRVYDAQAPTGLSAQIHAGLHLA